MQITDEASVPRELLFARIAEGGPALIVQLRDPELTAEALVAYGRELRQRTRAVGARLLVNDRLDVARAIDADGVHLGRRSVPVPIARAFLGEALVTCAAHTVDEAVALGEAGADAVLLSPIFASPNKGPALGVEVLRAARSRLSRDCALFALGGVDRDRANTCFAAGADGVAAIRADLGRW